MVSDHNGCWPKLISQSSSPQHRCLCHYHPFQKDASSATCSHKVLSQSKIPPTSATSNPITHQPNQLLQTILDSLTHSFAHIHIQIQYIITMSDRVDPHHVAALWGRRSANWPDVAGINEPGTEYVALICLLLLHI